MELQREADRWIIAVCSDKEHVHAEPVMFNNDICPESGRSFNAVSDIELRAMRFNAFQVRMIFFNHLFAVGKTAGCKNHTVVSIDCVLVSFVVCYDCTDDASIAFFTFCNQGNKFSIQDNFDAERFSFCLKCLNGLR